MSEIVLVTGAEGLIGYAVAKRLLASGAAVIGMDQRIEDAASLGCRTIEADVSDVHALYAAFMEHRPKGIVHCGAISGPMLARDAPELLFRTNVTGTLNLLEAARHARARRFVFCSSLMVYGANDGSPLEEDSPLLPSDAYGASKVAAETIVDAYAAHHGLDAVSARLAWVYGPRRRTPCGLRRMLSDALAGRPTRLQSGLSAMRQYVHVDDVAAALLALLRAPHLPRRSYNVSGGDFRGFAEVVDAVRRLFPSADITVGDEEDPDDPPMGPLSIGAIVEDVGWKPSIPLSEGLADYAEWLRSRRP
jgi:nucleoside-diphosphate-sugar epimerase